VSAVHLAFLGLPSVERDAYFGQAALERGIQPPIMEKDFWVSWLLGVLFSHTELGEHLVFKGGTALSKVAHAIERFSEDIDLSLSPALLGIDEAEVEAAVSRAQRDRWMERLEAECTRVVNSYVQPILETAIRTALGPPPDRHSWLESLTDEISHSPVLLFHYPSVVAAGFAYLSRAVKLEFGSLTDQRPTGHHPVVPWIAEVLPAVFVDWHCDVVALEVERTFWEKATILHAEAHRKADTPMPPRYSRHYADLAALARGPVATRALAMTSLRERVVAWKSRFFARGWARYDLAAPGTFRLLPPESRYGELRVDYVRMRDMYLAEPPSYDDVIQTLTKLEQEINRGTST
jgi:hypothetical protein